MKIQISNKFENKPRNKFKLIGINSIKIENKSKDASSNPFEL